jgi:DNA-directed RNA polymerase subunit RPC12/RpoP
MDLKVLLGSALVAVLFFLGAVFALASTYEPLRLMVAALLFAAGFGVITVLYIFTRKPSEIVQRIDLSGDIKAAPIKCTNCGASISPSSIRAVEGVPYATCDYCRHTVEIVEEPKW